MGEEIDYIDEMAPLTEEQWDRIITWGRLRYGQHAAQGLVAARDFTLSMLQIQQTSGHTQSEVDSLGQAIIKIAK